MAPLSKALAGVILNHDACETYLDDSGCTRDVELEKENFRVFISQNVYIGGT